MSKYEPGSIGVSFILDSIAEVSGVQFVDTVSCATKHPMMEKEVRQVIADKLTEMTTNCEEITKKDLLKSVDEWIDKTFTPEDYAKNLKDRLKDFLKEA
jgi:hypothetical protein